SSFAGFAHMCAISIRIQIMWIEIERDHSQCFKGRWINYRHIVRGLDRDPANITAGTCSHIRQSMENSFAKWLHQFQTVQLVYQNKRIATSSKYSFYIFQNIHGIFKRMQSNEPFTNYFKGLCSF